MSVSDPPDDGEFSEFDDPKVREFLRGRKRRNKESSVENDKTVFRQYLSFLGDTSVSQADFRDVTKFADGLAKKGVTSSTMRVYMSTISKFHQFLNNMYRAGMPSVVSIPEEYNNLPAEHEREALDREEIVKLIEATGSQRDALIIALTYYEGLRATATSTLKKKDVNLENDTIYLDNLKNSGERTLSIHQDIKFLLKTWLEKERPAYPPAEDSPYVFVGERSAERLYKQKIWKIVHEAAEQAGIQEEVGETADGSTIYRVKTHVLRHSFATHGFEDGMTREELASFLGQENVDTVDTYIHTNEIEDALESYNRDYEGL